MIRFILTITILTFATLPSRAMEIQEVTSPGGIKAWLVSEPLIPMIALEMYFDGGALLDPDDKLGATNLMVGLIEEGSRDLDSLGFAAAAENLASRFGYDAAHNGVYISATMLSENRDATIELLAGALNDPTFDPIAITRVKGQISSIIRSDASDPGTLAGQAFTKALFPDHPINRPLNGTLETLEALTRDDMFAAHQRNLVKSRVTIGVVGDITAEELGPMLDQLLGGLPSVGPELPDDAVPAEAKEVIVIDYETPQSVAIFGHAGIDRTDPEFMAAYVASSILGGGGLDSRLTTEVRVKRGLTYGIYSYLGGLSYAEVYRGSVSSGNESIGEVVDLVRAEWQKMEDQGATAEELERTKRYLTGAYPLRFTSNGQIANTLVGLQQNELPIDYIDTRNDVMNALTLDQVNAAIRRVLKPEMLRFVIVGQPEGLSDVN